MEQLDKYFKIARWIAEDLANVIHTVDKKELDDWLAESGENSTTYQELIEAFISGEGNPPYSEREVQQQLKIFYARKNKKSILIKYWYRYAAILVVLIGLAGFIRWQMSQKDRKTVDVMKPSIQMAQGTTRLILSTGKEIMLTDSLQIVKEEPSVDIQVSAQGLFYNKGETTDEKDVYNKLLVPRGGEFKVQLADGTNVWLNSQSELRYPVRFEGKERVVYLKGEGYFEVAPNRKKPFIVKTSESIDVKVLGTKFNIAAYAEDVDVTTTLIEGSVEVILPKQVMPIVPNEQLVFNKLDNTYKRKQVDASIYAGWKDGAFVFEDQTLEQIMERLRRWYEMEVFYTNEEIKNYRFTGDLMKYENFEKAVRMIEEVAGAKVEINGKCVIIGAK